ncbi:hypothetical protein [Nocardia suismassiliense]|uniref:hypothetical protein n=1 Tax=Nocardia suismassiliense TaxID=2077092 RepID=UPI000D1EA1AF|nr:hypothetical protein [Nocardia suismassiliense]
MNRPNISGRRRAIGLRIAHHALIPLQVAGRLSGRALLGLLAVAMLGMGVLSVAVLTTDRDTSTTAASGSACATPCTKASGVAHHLGVRGAAFPAAERVLAPVPGAQFPDPAVATAPGDWPFATSATATTVAVHLDLGGSTSWHIDI